MSILHAILFAALLLSAPATPLAAETSDSKSNVSGVKSRLDKIPDIQFCMDVGKNLRLPMSSKKQPYTELLMDRAGREFSVEAVDYQPITNRSLRIGMSWCAVMAAWGRPDHSNKHTTSAGTNSQWVYTRGRYAYLQGGTLTSWQE